MQHQFWAINKMNLQHSAEIVMENNSNESDAERAMIGDMTNSNYNDTYIRISTTVGAMPHS